MRQECRLEIHVEIGEVDAPCRAAGLERVALGQELVEARLDPGAQGLAVGRAEEFGYRPLVEGLGERGRLRPQSGKGQERVRTHLK